MLYQRLYDSSVVISVNTLIFSHVGKRIMRILPGWYSPLQCIARTAHISNLFYSNLSTFSMSDSFSVIIITLCDMPKNSRYRRTN